MENSKLVIDHPQKKRITFFLNNFDIFDKHSKEYKQVKLQDFYQKYRKYENELKSKTLVNKVMSINLQKYGYFI